jgi:hypothetical protein
VAQEVGRLVTLNGSRDKTNLIPALRDLTDEQLMAVLEKTGSRFLISFNDDEIYEIIEDKSADCRVAVLMHMNQSYIPLLLWANPDNDEERALAEGILAGMNANQLVSILARVLDNQRLGVVQHLPQSIREELRRASPDQRRTLLAGLDGDQRRAMEALLQAPPPASASSVVQQPPPPAASRPPAGAATAAQRASETLRSGKPLLRLPEILNGCNRRDQNMYGDGWCGFYAILSQTDQRFGGDALATRQGVQSQEVKKAVGDLQEELGYTRGSTVVDDWLDTQRLQRVAQHTKRAVVLIDTMESRGGNDVKQIDLAIPMQNGEVVVLTVASPDALGLKFSEWARNLLRENASNIANVNFALRQLLPANVNLDTCTVREAIEGLLRNPQTIGLLHPTPNHFRALQPPAAPAAPARSQTSRPPAPPQASRPPAPRSRPPASRPAYPASLDELSMRAEALIIKDAELRIKAELRRLNSSGDKAPLIDRLRNLTDEQLMAVLSKMGPGFLTRFSANEIYEIIENKSANCRAAVLMNMKHDHILNLLRYNPTHGGAEWALAEGILAGIGVNQLVPILARVPTNQRPEVVQNLKPNPQERLTGISREQRRTLLEGLKDDQRSQMEALLQPPPPRTGWGRLFSWR